MSKEERREWRDTPPGGSGTEGLGILMKFSINGIPHNVIPPTYPQKLSLFSINLFSRITFIIIIIIRILTLKRGDINTRIVPQEIKTHFFISGYSSENWCGLSHSVILAMCVYSISRFKCIIYHPSNRYYKKGNYK